MKWITVIKEQEINKVKNKNRRNANMKNFTISKKIWISTILGLIVLLMVAGCVNKAQEPQEVTPTPEVTTPEVTDTQGTPVEATPLATPVETTTLIVERGNKEMPKTPISVSMSMPHELNLNEAVDISIVVNSTKDAPNTSVELILPEGISLVSDNSTWKVDLVAKTPVSLSAKIALIKIGQWDIKVLAKKVIDQDNSWGDVDMAYIGYKHSVDDVPTSATSDGNTAPVRKT